MRQPLILPMMMFGKFRSTRAKRDKDGNTIINGYYKNGNPKYEKQKCWVTHSEKDGDKGVYPSVNHIYTRMHKGRQKLTKPAEDLKAKWEALSMMWAQDNHWEMTKDEKVVVELIAHFPADNLRRDTNNVFKLMLDSFNDILYDDDEFALPRVIDFDKVSEGEKPYFELNIYKKSEEDEVFMERMADKE